MAIRMRRGLMDDFDPSKMLPGEWAISIDSDTSKQIVWMCFQNGIVKRMGTYEDFHDQIFEMTDEVTQEYIQKYEELIPQIQSLLTRTNEAENQVVYIINDLQEKYDSGFFKGEKGDTGSQGPKGENGLNGTKGDTGPQGTKGDKGEQGVQGIVGPQGAQGIKGEKGDKGDKGDRGDSGVTVPISGLFSLSGDADGNLYAYYADGSTAPSFETDSSGNIYYNTPTA